MQITIDVSDFYLDEEKELEPALKNHITNSVIREIHQTIKDKVNEQITKSLLSQFHDSLEAIIQTHMQTFVAEGKIVSNYKETSIQDHLKKLFMEGSGWGNPQDQMRKLATTFGLELKNRYDLMFASQIVAKLNDQGMLKEDIAKLILPPSNS